MSAARSLVAVAMGIISLSPAVIRTAAASDPPAKPSADWRSWIATRALVTLTPQTDDFASGSGISAVNGTSEVNLDPANAYDNVYAVHFSVSVTINGHASQYGTATLVVAIETNDGSGWVERATYSYPCGYPSGPPPYSARTCSSWTHEQPSIAVTGLGLNDDIRLKAKSFSTSNGAGGSFVIRGGDAGGPNPGTYNGITYTTDIQPVSWPQSDDFASGNGIGAVGATAGLTLDPGGAFDNIYTVHYFVSVTINAHPTTFGTATLTVAFETNDGTGSGWVERGTTAYNCGYLSGPPPYPQRTCPGWTHEQVPMTVTGLGINDSIRLKAKTFTTSNGAGGSFVIRGGDGSGVNPETYNGVTYTTKVFRGVAVRPELPERQGFASTASSQRFFVKNRGETDANLSVGFSCVTLTNCSVTPTSFSYVPPGESRLVTLTYTTGAVGTTGTGMVKVFDNFDNNTIRDSASVAVKGISTSRPLVSLVDVNAGATLERGQCLTIAAGSAGAFECGDLRIIHGLAAIRTLNKARVPILLYNSASADPYPIVAASVTLPSGSLPDSVQAVLKVGGVEKARGRWAGSDWTPGATRRIALGYSAAADTTKVYDYTLEVAGLSDTLSATSVSGKLIVVNRRGGGLGAGWWVSGVERLEHLADGNKLWIGGDGSARLFTTAGTNVWVAARVQRPDTLRWDGSTYYVRKLPGGLQVKFNSSGQHVLTVNRLGHQTTFAYSSGRLASITLPSQGGGQMYSFAYDGNGQLSGVTAPGPRVTTVWVNALRVDSIRDPDNRVTKFTYDGSTRRIATRIDRRGTITTYSYDAAAKVWRAHINLQPDSIRIGFRARDVIGLATATPKTATDTANVYTSVFGARNFTSGANYIAQETKFWLDRYGAPRRVLNALNNQTIVKREEGEWESVATELQVANGFISRGRYDPRGNIIASVSVNPLATGQDAITRFHWDPVWDFADSAVTATGVVTTMAHSGANGNRLWQQVGTDPARRVTFRYGNTLGLISSTVLPGTPPDSIEYDAMGNVSVVRTPKGYDTRYTRDLIGRDTMVQVRIDTLSAIYQTTITQFDVLDRDTLLKNTGPAMNGVAAETVYVRKVYNPTSQIDTLRRWSRPDATSIGTMTTSWEYDLAGRKIREIAPDGRKERWTHDPAGNVVEDSTRRGHIMTMTYTALDQLATRALPAVSYNSRSSNIIWPEQSDYPAYQIPADNQVFTYTTLGQLQTADNAHAKIKRSYYPGGLLERDSSWIQTVALNDWTQHKYGIRHEYDLDGREKTLFIPSQLVASGIWDDIAFGYDVPTGLLQTVSDLHHDVYTLSYNNRMVLAGIAYPAQYQETFTYDADGRLASDTIRNLGSTAFPRLGVSLARAKTYRYDARSLMMRSSDPTAFQDTLNVAYSGLGHIRTSALTQHGVLLYGGADLRFSSSETFSFDALGNRYYGQTYDETRINGQFQSSHTSNHISTFEPGTGRITLDAVVGGQTTFFYDLAGNTEFSSNEGSQNGPAEERASFYGAEGLVRAVDWRFVQSPTQVLTFAKYAFDEYRYDALGRRVWVWSKKSCAEEGSTQAWWEAAECKTSLIRRTVWNGDQEFVEIQMPGGSAGDEVTLYENDQSAVQLGNLSTQLGPVDRNQFFGRVVYIPGRGIDQPLAVTRINYGYQHLPSGASIAYKVLPPLTSMPFWNSTGDPQLGVFSNGARLYCTPPNQQSDCVGVVWPYYWSAFDRHRSTVWDNWHGTILESKRDKTNLGYSRNRYYDPQTGRFTQEDPSGLAGGLNLYGFAGGDPINFGDPFGLCKVEVQFTTAGFVGNHATIVTTAADGSRTFFSSGPANGRGPSSGGRSSGGLSGSGGSSGQSSGSESNSANSSSPGSGPGDGKDENSVYGDLTAHSGSYEEGKPEYQPDAPRSTFVDDDRSCDDYHKAFEQAITRINAANIVYNPFTTNSNAAAWEMLRAAGIPTLKKSLPVSILPGWGRRLF